MPIVRIVPAIVPIVPVIVPVIGPVVFSVANGISMQGDLVAPVAVYSKELSIFKET